MTDSFMLQDFIRQGHEECHQLSAVVSSQEGAICTESRAAIPHKCVEDLPD